MLTVFCIVFLQVFSQSQGLTCSKCNYPCQPGTVEKKIECDTFCYTYELLQDENGVDDHTKQKDCARELKNVEHPRSLCENKKKNTKGSEKCTWCDDEDFCNGKPKYELCDDCKLKFKDNFSYELLVKLLLLRIYNRAAVSSSKPDIQEIILDTEDNRKCKCDELQVETLSFPNFVKIALLLKEEHSYNAVGVPRPLGKFLRNKKNSCFCEVDVEPWKPASKYITFAGDWAESHGIDIPKAEEGQEILAGIFKEPQPCEDDLIIEIEILEVRNMIKLILLGAQHIKYYISGVPRLSCDCLISLFM